MKVFKKQLNGGYLFLASVILLYLVLGFFDFDLVWNGLRTTSALLLKISPMLLLVFGINFLVNKFLRRDKIAKHLGEESGKAGFFYATVSGILFSGPPYVLFPLLKDLKEKGMKDSLIAVFLYNRNVKIPFMPVMVYYFGLPFTVILSVYIVIFSLFNGLIVEALLKRDWKM